MAEGKGRSGLHKNTLQAQLCKGRLPYGEGEWRGGMEAVLTAEAALTVPFLLLILVGLLYWIPFMQFHLSVQLTMEELSQKASIYLSAGDPTIFGENETAGDRDETAELLWSAGVPAAVGTFLTSRHEEAMRPAGISGMFQTMYSSVDRDGEVVDIVVGYREQLKGLPAVPGSFWVIQRSRRRLWTGQSLEAAGETGENGQIVYVTENGSVYHVDPCCTYLRRTILYRAMEEIAGARNEGGEIYRPCERCMASTEDWGAYITTYGNRFHNSVLCPSLQRNINAISLDQVGMLSPCTKCGGE